MKYGIIEKFIFGTGNNLFVGAEIQRSWYIGPYQKKDQVALSQRIEKIDLALPMAAPILQTCRSVLSLNKSCIAPPHS